MTQPTNHLDDDVLSALVDDQLLPAEAALAQSHLGTCEVCRARVDEFRSVAQLLRRLPDVLPPRDFALGPRVVADPPNVIRLQRWYTVSRVAAASLAAVFVLLSAGTLYVDSRPATVPSSELARPEVVSAPAGSNAAAPAPAPAVPARAAASPVPALAPASGAAARAPAPATTPQADDQVAAATTVRALPTLLPTPTAVLPPALVPVARASLDASDPAAPLRTGAVLFGVLAVVALLATLVIRHRLRPSHL